MTNTTSAAWEILRATEYAEMRRESEEKIRQKIEDEARLRRLMEQNLGQERDDYIRNYIKEKLNNVVEDNLKKLKVNLSNKIKGKLRTEQRELNDKINKELEETQNKIEEEAQQKFKRLKGKLEENTAQTIRQQFSNLKAYRSMDSELRKLQAAIILFPVLLVTFGAFFRNRVDDIMSIDALQTEIKHLQEEVKALQPSRGQGAHQPWKEPPLPPWGDEP